MRRSRSRRSSRRFGAGSRKRPAKQPCNYRKCCRANLDDEKKTPKMIEKYGAGYVENLKDSLEEMKESYEFNIQPFWRFLGEQDSAQYELLDEITEKSNELALAKKKYASILEEISDKSDELDEVKKEHASIDKNVEAHSDIIDKFYNTMEALVDHMDKCGVTEKTMALYQKLQKKLYNVQKLHDKYVKKGLWDADKMLK